VADTRVGSRRRHRAENDPASRAQQPQVAQPGPGRFNGLVHERTRLAIVAALAARDRLSFAELKAILKTTDGNVSAHARKLEDAGYILSHKRFEGRTPRTEYELTAAGRVALSAYLEDMEQLIRSMRRG
jgi:DNA-binding transcriptional ArsR family regulator